MLLPEIAERIRDREAAALARELEIESAMLADAVSGAGGMPDGYWKARHAAERRLRAADAVYAAITDCLA